MYKRIIFTLLYDNGNFVLSRNFRLQHVGDLNWLQHNYCFGNLASSIDELLILDVTRGARDSKRFCETVRGVVAGCFVPVGVGGGIGHLETVDRVMSAGADKIVINSTLAEQPDLTLKIAEFIGAQSIIASIDVKMGSDGIPTVFTHQGSSNSGKTLSDYLMVVSDIPVGEIMVTSIDRDGTGKGLDLSIVDHIPLDISQPLILGGGVGHAAHLTEGLRHDRLAAVATANLLNFIGDGLEVARRIVDTNGVRLATFG